MKQQQLSDDLTNNKFKMNRNSLPAYPASVSNCHLCLRNLQSSPSLVMIINDHYYHRDCFKCYRCDKYLAENEAHTLIEHKYLYCGNCFIKRKPLQSTHATDQKYSNGNSLSNTSQQHATTANNLNELKLKFESVQRNNAKYSSSNFNKSNQHNDLNYNTLSFSSSSSSSNFSLSPSSSSSWSSSNNSSIAHTTNTNSQINQRITMLNNLAAASRPNEIITNETKLLKNKRISNESKTSIDLDSATPSTPNLKRNDSKKTLFSSAQTSPTTDFYLTNTNGDSKVVQSPIINDLQPFKQHSSKCNIILRKMRRGNKRSKSVPTKFNVDSLLDYLNCSMVLNKYELKKLNQQRNMLLNSNNGILIYNSKNRYRQLLNYNPNNPNSNSYKIHQFSSGYNSENHSNSSNSTTNGTNTSISSSNSFLTNKNMINFYRLSLSHLPMHFLNLQCTCGTSNLNSSVDLSRLNDALLSSSSSSIGCFTKDKSANKFDEDFDYDDDEDDEDDEDDDDLEEDEDDLNHNTSVDDNLLNQTATLELSPNIEKEEIKPEVDIRFQFNSSVQRAPGTSHCQHTVRVDIRRVRSCKDLTQLQYIYSPNDFMIKEKLGEGFFANVKKIISKQTNQELVLKELKLSAINNENPPLNLETDLKSDEQLNSLARGDFLINYAELNAAHKSFLKEAQVLRNLNHPNVIKFMGIMFTKEKHLNLILEYISGGTLKDIIHNISNVLPWKLRVGYAKDIAAAMEYLHSLNIIHRDLKSDNCLVRENGRTVVVADFGLSRINNYNTTAASNENPIKLFKKLNDSFNLANSVFKIQNSAFIPSNSYIQSPQSSSSATNSFIVAAKRKLKRHNHQRKQRYAVVGNSFSMAPEMLKHQIYDERVDIFSFGIICCEIIGRVQADPDYLPRTSDFGLNVELFRKKYCEADCPKHFIKIAIACCELEPDKRPPFTKTHLWLETILSHLESNNPIPKNLLKNILDQNTKRPLSSLIYNQTTNENQQVHQSKN